MFTDLVNPDEDSADIPAGAVSADVVLAGTDKVAIGPADLDLAEGVHTIVYAWGSAEDDNLKLAVQTISGLHSAPSGVPGGTGWSGGGRRRGFASTGGTSWPAGCSPRWSPGCSPPGCSPGRPATGTGEAPAHTRPGGRSPSWWPPSRAHS